MLEKAEKHAFLYVISSGLNHKSKMEFVNDTPELSWAIAVALCETRLPIDTTFFERLRQFTNKQGGRQFAEDLEFIERHYASAEGTAGELLNGDKNASFMTRTKTRGRLNELAKSHVKLDKEIFPSMFTRDLQTMPQTPSAPLAAQVAASAASVATNKFSKQGTLAIQSGNSSQFAAAGAAVMAKAEFFHGPIIDLGNTAYAADAGDLNPANSMNNSTGNTYTISTQQVSHKKGTPPHSPSFFGNASSSSSSEVSIENTHAKANSGAAVILGSTSPLPGYDSSTAKSTTSVGESLSMLWPAAPTRPVVPVASDVASTASAAMADEEVENPKSDRVATLR